ncbi:MAG: hypothetical protein LBU73_06345 [Helicobacteraceae bacterium]|jgi:hypothetical protein|nr:hypothetical protein [Helicobacteraceae bacterium]
MALKSGKKTGKPTSKVFNNLRGWESIISAGVMGLGVLIAGSGFIAILLGIGKEAGYKMIAATIILGVIVMIIAGAGAYIVERRR